VVAEEVRMMADRRAEWAKRVRQWRHSGQTARAFAASIGVKSGSLTHWAWRLKRETAGAGSGRRRARPPVPGSPVVEIIAGRGGGEGFELTLGNGRRLSIPTQFESAALRRLIAVLEEPA
jgi:hypothetical protein